jgi:hypothetical protein
MPIHREMTGDEAIHPAAYVQDADPGSVGEDRMWIDTTGSTYVIKVRNVTNDGWTTIYDSGASGGSAVVLAPAADQMIQPTGAAVKPLIIRAHASQSADILEVENSAGTDLFTITSSGRAMSGSSFLLDAADPATLLVTAIDDDWTIGARGIQGGYIAGFSSRGTIATPTALSSGDLVLALTGLGHDGTVYVSAASMDMSVDGTPGTNDMPGRITFSTSADGSATPTERVRIDSSGRVGIGVTPSVSDSILSISKGITFPATQVASSNANTLDDYEEGSFTMGLQFSTAGTPTFAYSSSTGLYTKVGRLVTIHGRLTTSTFTYTGSSGTLQLTGLPFAPVTLNGYGACVFRGHTATFDSMGIRPTAGQTYCDFIYSNGTSALNTLQNTNVASGATVDIVFSAIYSV